MSTVLQTRAEITKLARLMGTDPGELGYLEAVAPDDLAAFREQLTDTMFAGDRARLLRVAQAAKVVPGPISAAIAQRALGPVICARLAGLLEPGKAADIAKRLPTAFLTDVAIELDPRRASGVIPKISAKQIGEVAAELAARDESVTLGRFVAFVSDDGLRAALPRIGEATLLRTAFVMEGKERLDHVVSLVAEERLAAILRAAEDADLWAEALDLLGNLGPAGATRLVGAVSDEPGLVDALLAAVDARDAWPQLLRLLADLDDDVQQRLVAPLEALPAADRARVEATARELGLVERLGPLARA